MKEVDWYTDDVYWLILHSKKIEEEEHVLFKNNITHEENWAFISSVFNG